MITEIDIRDFQALDCEKARIALDKCGAVNEGYWKLQTFIDQVESVQRKYTKPIAALLKGPNG